MIRPGEFEVRAQRHQPFTLSVDYPGVNLAAAAFQFDVRSAPEIVPGAINLANAAAGLDGVSVTVEMIAGVPTSHILVSMTELTVDSLPQPATVGSELQWVYGFKINGILYMRGAFIVEGSAAF